nr:hypothetical protein [Streptomyces hydrogenans]
MACAPPAPTTPGRVQPGKGSWRSYAPVASSTARARTGSPAASSVRECTDQSVPEPVTLQTWCSVR